VDEAHERSLATDMLLGLLKKVRFGVERQTDPVDRVMTVTLSDRLLADRLEASGSAVGAYQEDGGGMNGTPVEAVHTGGQWWVG
jgi:hypothetical protein